MAMIECLECHVEISSNAVSCPHCGNPSRKKSTETMEVQLSVTTSAGALGGLIALVGVLCIFFLPPIGLLMLLVAGVLSLFGKKKVLGLQGECPNFAKLINIQKVVQAADCPICKARFLNDGGRFVQT